MELDDIESKSSIPETEAATQKEESESDESDVSSLLSEFDIDEDEDDSDDDDDFFSKLDVNGINE